MREDIEKAVEVLAGAVNVMGSADVNAKWFMAALMHQHRTLQQGAIGLMIGVLRQYAEIEDGWVDPRNEAAREACRKLKPVIDENLLHLMPLI